MINTVNPQQCTCGRNDLTVPLQCPVHSYPPSTYTFLPYIAPGTVAFTEPKPLDNDEVKNKMVATLVKIIDLHTASVDEKLKAIELLNKLGYE